MSIKTVKHFTPDYTISGSTMMHGFAISALAGFLASIVGENPLAISCLSIILFLASTYVSFVISVRKRALSSYREYLPLVSPNDLVKMISTNSCDRVTRKLIADFLNREYPDWTLHSNIKSLSVE